MMFSLDWHLWLWSFVLLSLPLFINLGRTTTFERSAGHVARGLSRVHSSALAFPVLCVPVTAFKLPVIGYQVAIPSDEGAIFIPRQGLYF